MKMTVLEYINQAKPNSLYHYTNLNALIGIVKNKELWMSNLWFLNDKNEYCEGLDIIKSECEKRKEEHKANKKISIFLNTLNSAIALLQEQSVYIFSLTTNNDLLSQWRGYGNSGVNVEFDLLSIPDVKLFPCIYDPAQQEKYVSHIFSQSIELFSSSKECGTYPKEWCTDKEEEPYWDAINVAGSNFISKCNVACALIKNNGFAEESEWRMLKFSEENLCFLSKGTFIRPYVKLKLSGIEKIIKGIKIGQNPEIDLCKKSINELLRSENLNNSVQISSSIIPYRG